MSVLLLSVASLVLYLLYERIRIDRWRQKIPMVIAVTGTRGKSSVTRMLASVLRSDGRKILAKTTGSSPKMLWPDGHETDIRRRGSASILEQQTLLKHAAALEVDCVIAEVMSIHRENHFVESRQMLKPNIVVVTNTWPDHVDAHGETEEEVAAALCFDITEKANVFVPSTCDSTAFEASTDVAHGKLFVIDEDNAMSVRQRVQELETAEFAGNIALVHGVARHLGLYDETIADGLATMSRDSGALAIREMRVGDPEKHLILVSAFAANDPTSTFRVLNKAREVIPESAAMVGLLCLRSDRGDRTAHWLDTLRNGTSDPFASVYVTGGHSSVVARQLASARKLMNGSPDIVMKSIASEVDDGTVVFGFGNFVGLGSQLVEYWNTEGVAYGL